MATRAELAELADRLDAKRKAFDQALSKDQGVLVRWLSGPLIEPSELDACAADCLLRLSNAANRLASPRSTTSELARIDLQDEVAEFWVRPEMTVSERRQRPKQALCKKPLGAK